MSNLKDIKIVSRDPTKGSFVRGGMTIQLDASGNPEQIEDNVALDQDVMKAIFTGVQPDGYGTVVRQVIGDKNIGVVRAMLTFTLISSLQTLIRIQGGLNWRFPTRFRLGRVLNSVDFIRARDVTVESVEVLMSFRTQAGTTQSLSVPINSTKD